MDRDDPAYRGQRDYSRPLLNLYDPLVLGPIARFVWRCPTPRLVERYQRHIRTRHLDIGPGTGYFIERSGLPLGSKVTIVDPNINVLRHTSRRLARLDVVTVEADVCKPLPLEGRFDSAALHLVIHCLPGPHARKTGAIANVAKLLEPDGVLFGASVLGDPGPHTWLSRRVLHTFNRRGAFDNLDENSEALDDMLRTSFEEVDIELVGSIALFTASQPRVRDPGQ